MRISKILSTFLYDAFSLDRFQATDTIVFKIIISLKGLTFDFYLAIGVIYKKYDSCLCF